MYPVGMETQTTPIGSQKEANKIVVKLLAMKDEPDTFRVIMEREEKRIMAWYAPRVENRDGCEQKKSGWLFRENGVNVVIQKHTFRVYPPDEQNRLPGTELIRDDNAPGAESEDERRFKRNWLVRGLELHLAELFGVVPTDEFLAVLSHPAYCKEKYIPLVEKRRLLEPEFEKKFNTAEDGVILSWFVQEQMERKSLAEWQEQYQRHLGWTKGGK